MRGIERQTTNLLMGQDISTNLALLALHDLDVSLHALGSESLGEQVTDVRVRM